jgi:hypothetical protein
MAEPTERDRERAMEWYAAEPPEVEACPTMFAGDAIAIYARGLADERARLAPPSTPEEARDRRERYACEAAYCRRDGGGCANGTHDLDPFGVEMVRAMEAEAAHQGKVNDGEAE